MRVAASAVARAAEGELSADAQRRGDDGRPALRRRPPPTVMRLRPSGTAPGSGWRKAAGAIPERAGKPNDRLAGGGRSFMEWRLRLFFGCSSVVGRKGSVPRESVSRLRLVRRPREAEWRSAIPRLERRSDRRSRRARGPRRRRRRRAAGRRSGRPCRNSPRRGTRDGPGLLHDA